MGAAGIIPTQESVFRGPFLFITEPEEARRYPQGMMMEILSGPLTKADEAPVLINATQKGYPDLLKFVDFNQDTANLSFNEKVESLFRVLCWVFLVGTKYDTVSFRSIKEKY